MIRIENMLNQAHMWCFVNAQPLCMIRIENMLNQALVWCFVNAQQLCMFRIENMLNQAHMWCFFNLKTFLICPSGWGSKCRCPWSRLDDLCGFLLDERCARVSFVSSKTQKNKNV